MTNNTPSTVHEETPSVLMLGRSPPRPWKQEEIGNLQERFDAVRRRIKQKREQWEKRQKQKHSHTHTFKTGDQILIKTLKVTDKARKKVAKFTKPYSGPFHVSEVIGNNTYRIYDSLNNVDKGKWHINLLVYIHIACYYRLNFKSK